MAAEHRTGGRARAAAVVVALLLAGALAVAPAVPAGADPYCGITWGSLAKRTSPYTGAPVTGVRVGRHACFDRMVVDLHGGPQTGYQVRYAAQVKQDGSGAVMPVRGGARLQVAVHAPAYNRDWFPTYWPANAAEAVDVRGFDTFRQVRYLGSFEGITSFGLGVRGRLPFRVFVLPGPGSGHRLVIDVAHYW